MTTPDKPGSPGGTEGGSLLFLFGFVLSMTSLWFFFDSVRVTTSGFGYFSGLMGGGGGRGGLGFRDTTSMGILFVPFFIATIALFYDYGMRWARWLFWIGIAIIVVEILSRIRFHLDMKNSLLLLMMVGFCAGAGLMLRSYFPRPGKASSTEQDNPA